MITHKESHIKGGVSLITRVMTFVLLMSSVQWAFGHVLPTKFTSCSPGPTTLVQEFRDINNNGVFDEGVDPEVTGQPKRDGELLFLRVKLAHSSAAIQCAFSGGQLFV